MSSDFDPHAVAENITAMVPFTAKLGFSVQEARPGYARLALPHDPSNLNHVGSLHAGAIFTLLETVAGMALISALGELASRLLVTGARISYKRKVLGGATAVAEVPSGLATQVEQEIAAEGKSFFSFSARLFDEAGELCAECAFDYRVKPPA